MAERHGVKERKVTTSAKSLRITARNSNIKNSIDDELGKRQLRNRCIILKKPQVNKSRKTFSQKVYCKGSITNFPNNSVPVDHLENLSLHSSSVSSLKNWKGASISSRNIPLKHSCSSVSFFTNIKSEGIQEENLDYEPDDVINFETNQNLSFGNKFGKSSVINELAKHSQASLRCANSNLNTRHFSPDVLNTNSNTSYYESSGTDDCLSTVSHKSEMIPYDRHLDRAQDGRQDDYLIYTPSPSNKIILDSSSSGYSGNSCNDEMEEDQQSDSEEYEMTQEEESRLLESDEDSQIENENSNSEKNSDHHSTETYQSQSIYQNAQSNNQLIEDNTESQETSSFFQGSRVTMRDGKIIIMKNEKTYRKWNVHYHPYKNNSLFLNDIGYIPTPPVSRSSRSSSDSGDNISEVSSTKDSIGPMTSFKVTLGANHKRKCESVPKSIQSFDSGFKVPFLPPIKRPPTRPKRSSCGTPSTNVSPSSSISDSSDNFLRERFLADVNSRRDIIQPPKEDDAISIMASSIGNFDHHEQDLTGLIKEENESFVDSDKKSLSIFNPTLNNMSYVQNWVSSHPHPLPEADLLSDTVPKPEETQVRKLPDTRLNFKELHPFFHGLCFFHYFNGNCSRLNCYQPHVVNQPVFIKKCKDISSTDLQSIYNFTLRFHVLFRDMYPCLLKGFAFHRMQNSLIASTSDFFALKQILDPSIAIKKITAALEETGLTFLEAIETVSFNVGFMRYPELADILLDIITLRPNISENWEEIKRICRVKNYISPKILERIISKVLVVGSINNKDLCRDIYNFIIKREMTDLSQVNEDLLKPIKTLAQFGNNTNTLSNSIDKNLLKERQRFELSRQPNEPQELIINEEIVSDSDERLKFPFGNQQRSPSNSSSRSSTISAKFSIEQPNENENISPLRANYQYVPQALAQPVKTPLLPTPVPLMVNYNRAQKFGAEINLCPEIPVFGKFKYKPGFEFNVSLHNLLLINQDQVPMNDPDIVNLNDVIKHGNGAGFLQLLDQYKGPNTLQHFITMSIAHLRNCDSRRPFNRFIDLIENVGTVNPYFKRDPLLKGVFEVIVFNLLFFLERNCQWSDAKKLIEMFCDWDSLISSKLLQQFAIRTLTPMGRFIFLAKVLAEAKAFYKVYDILHSPDLNLLKDPNHWPLYFSSTIDVEYRNLLLTDFFKFAHRHNVEVVCDMYRNIFQFGDIWEFDALSFYNPILEYLINNEKTSQLKHFFPDIDIFYKKMSNNVLRAFIIHMDGQFGLENKFKLFELAAKKGIYVHFTGQETSIIVRTNMPDVELKIILQYYMHKISYQLQDLLHDLRIEIRLPAELAQSPNILQKCVRSIKEVNNSVKQIFQEYFGIVLKKSQIDCNSTVIEISKEELRSAFR